MSSWQVKSNEIDALHCLVADMQKQVDQVMSTKAEDVSMASSSYSTGAVKESVPTEVSPETKILAKQMTTGTTWGGNRKGFVKLGLNRDTGELQTRTPKRVNKSRSVAVHPAAGVAARSHRVACSR